MTMPTAKDLHIESAIGDMSIGYRAGRFVAYQVFPMLPVRHKSDKYFEFKKGAFFRLDAGRRGPLGHARESGYVLDNGTYSCEEWALAHPVPQDNIDNADDPVQPIATGMGFLQTGLLRRREYQLSTLAMNVSNWTTTDDVAGSWAHTDTGNTFISDVESKKLTVMSLIGVEPNTLLVDHETWSHIKQTDDVLERIKYNGGPGDPAKVTAQMVAALFDLNEVIVGSAYYSDAEETVAGSDFNAVKLWEVNAGKGSALLYYKPPEPAIEVPSAGYMFSWDRRSRELPDDIVYADGIMQVRMWWESARRSWILEGSECYDMAITCAAAGCLFYDTILT